MPVSQVSEISMRTPVTSLRSDSSPEKWPTTRVRSDMPQWAVAKVLLSDGCCSGALWRRNVGRHGFSICVAVNNVCKLMQVSFKQGLITGDLQG